jgi:Cysteine rich repeat
MGASIQRVRLQEARSGLRDVLDNDIQPVTTKKGPIMLRAILTAAALLCASQAAFAQELTAAQRDACMGDYEKYCKSVVPGGGRIIACLAKESDKLAPACKKVLEAAEKK